jgi:hypothetical protein
MAAIKQGDKMKIHTPKSSVLSHLKPKSGFSPATDSAFPTNPGGVNLPMTKTKTGAGGNKMASMPSPKKSGKKLTT